MPDPVDRGKMFVGFGVHTFFGPDVTDGFDLAIGSEDGPEQRIYYFRLPTSDTDTSTFGGLLIVAEAMQ